MAFQLIIAAVLLLSFASILMMVRNYYRQPRQQLSRLMRFKLAFSGVIAFIADTLGIGSFAVNVALARIMGTFADDEMPAVNNGAQVIPGIFESIFFLKLVNVELTTLLTLVTGTCLGGILGALVVTRLDKQTVRLAMMICFTLIISLLIAHQFRLMPVGGDLAELHHWKLLAGFLAMVVCGSLTSVGIGLFVMVQGVLFLLNVSPAVAFPIMTTAGALQQPLTTMVFLQKDKIPMQKTLILSLFGCVGVFITLPVFTHLTISFLHNLLLGILIFNLYAISQSYLKTKQASRGMISLAEAA